MAAVSAPEDEAGVLPPSENTAQPGPIVAQDANEPRFCITSPEKGGMSEELKDIFMKLIDDQGHLDMRNVTTLIWVNRTKPQIVETIVELLIENSNERRVFNGIEFYLPQLAHMIIHLDVHLPSSALEHFALVVCQQSLHVALQLNWILVAALEDYHAELPDGSPNKKGNTVYFNRCAKLLQNVERIIALGAPSAAKLEEEYNSGKMSRHEMDARTIAERKRQAEKIISSPKRGILPAGDDLRIRGWLWHKRWNKRGFPHHNKWIKRWFEEEDRVLYCYNDSDHGDNHVKRAAVLYQASVVVCDYKDGKYPFYFEVHSPMGNMRLRAEDEEDKKRWIETLQKQSQAMPVVSHFFSQGDPTMPGLRSRSLASISGMHSARGQVTKTSPIVENTSSSDDNSDGGMVLTPALEGTEGTEGTERPEGTEGTESTADAGGGEARGELSTGEHKRGESEDRIEMEAVEKAAAALVDSTSASRNALMFEAKRNKRFKFFNEERKFVADLTEVCEVLRFEEDRSKRGAMLETLLMAVHVPECAYLPLCRSTEPFRRVLRITQNEAKAFSTKERVPAMVTFETEEALASHGEDKASRPLDVASFLFLAYGSHAHAPVHQDKKRGSSTALQGGQDSLIEPDSLTVTGDGREEEGVRHVRSGSFLFRGGSKGRPHMPPVHLSSVNFSMVWRDKTPGGDGASKARDARGTKSPFRHNLSSLSSALSARASSIRNVRLPAMLHHTLSRKNSQGHAVMSTADEAHNSVAGGTEVIQAMERGDMAGREHGTETGHPKNVAWQDEGSASEEKPQEMPRNGDAGAGGRKRVGDEGTQAVQMEDVPLDDDVDAPVEVGSTTSSPGSSDVEDESKNEEQSPATSCKAYGESMAQKAGRIRRESADGSRPGWTLQRMIVKSNDDVRQEVFVMQLIIFYREVFDREGLDLWLKPYSILSTSKTTGLIEVLNQATSFDGLKKSEGYAGSLLEHFHSVYGQEDSTRFKTARREFARSLAGYSVVSYLLRIKDRHNGNVMLDSDGHVTHIDFGFVLGSAPGNKFSMERAAFKMTQEYSSLLGGKGSKVYEEFVDMFTRGLLAARKYATVTITMIEIMMFQSEFPCFEYAGSSALKGFKKRLMLDVTEAEVVRRARKMVENADGHWGTCFYDRFQKWTNGILP